MKSSFEPVPSDGAIETPYRWLGSGFDARRPGLAAIKAHQSLFQKAASVNFHSLCPAPERIRIAYDDVLLCSRRYRRLRASPAVLRRSTQKRMP
jgi:hypothetical protein